VEDKLWNDPYEVKVKVKGKVVPVLLF